MTHSSLRRACLFTAVPALLITCAPRGNAMAGPGTPVPLEARPFFFALSVADVEAGAAWYARVFGFEAVRSVDLADRGARIRLMGRPGARLELVELSDAMGLADAAPEVTKRQNVHGVYKVGFEVGDLDEAVKRLEALGVPLRGRVFTESDGSMRSGQIEDPDGNIIQLFEVLAEPGRD